ncbi:hypothetical protein ASPBRDRAFT_126637 [Aspergillus brasiliensis CBS 101740]|uniref:Uncharacterized protein n=1 Tax=Aspergillus brasiliensis (strain CBS 101740 / IMI 381727 / IBT 21946) TaxID=767769 RepID=A0A1L9UHQ6_ASPBC|nr:hypothetical protein ASPBRDRAFT_126637 [Aspergillus brasiliensis CBS 101740]
MTSIVSGPLGRFRKNGSHKRLHERWGDVGITVPTEGSWNQRDNPHRSSDRRRPAYEVLSGGSDSTTPVDDPHESSTQPSSFSVKALNPRRLSMRISSRSKPTTTDYPKENTTTTPTADRQTKADRRVSQFSYRPIQQDYPTEMAEKASRQSQHSPRFKYIPTAPRYAEELGLPTSRRWSSQRDSVQSSCPSEGTRRSHRRYPDAEEDCYDDEYYEERRERYSRPLSTRRDRSSVDYYSAATTSSSSRRGSLALGRSGGTTEKRGRSGKNLTTAMVPDADDIYG